MSEYPGTLPENTALLSSIPLFAGLESAHLERMAQDCRQLDAPPHHTLFTVGQPVRDVYLLISGSVKRVALRSGDVEKVLELVGPGNLFPLSEVFAVPTYASCAETLAASNLLAIKADTLKSIARRDLKLSSRLLDMIALRQYASEFDVLRHRSLSVTQRVLDYLISLAEPERNPAGETTVRLAASKRLIAARLDMAPETLSRTLRQLSDDGLIVVDKRAIHIQNAPLSITASADPDPGIAAVQYPRLERGIAPKPLSSAELINLCGRQRMLSQRLASHWAMIHRGLGAHEARVSMRKCREQVQRNLRKLGTIDWPEPLQTRLARVQKSWQQFSEGLAQSAGDHDSAGRLFALSETMLESAEQLTTAVTEHAGSASANLVNVAGRNRMLCARTINLFLYSDWGVCPETTARLNDASRVEFQNNLARLAKAAGSSHEARAQLQIDADQWAVFLQKVDARTRSNPARSMNIVKAGEELLRHADTTVKLYEQLAAQIDEV